LLSIATTDSASGPLRACFSTLMQCDKTLLETQLNILKARIAGKRGPVFWIREPVPFWPRDPGWVKNQDPAPGWTLNNQNHISESIKTIFWVKNT
jgi:hypothetical protein